MKLIKLPLNLIPITSWWKNARSQIKPSQWNKIRKQVYQQANYACEICGVKKVRLDCNEVWKYQSNKQILAKLEAVCRLCHLAQHLGYAGVIGRFQEAKEHLKKVNGWNEKQTLIYIQEKFREWEVRNKVKWVLDLNYLDNFG
ncbi:HNH endonuclease [endosymbiont GvMRE of Glomus versiforme]|uniref:HNH endonuclease n=1 Tax=endosymbiont GvMRE of Glomus versiforme TaxID=2039283 RepID=UPI000ED1C077|nr:HNH endonuclease [endosymbiont GvMRE of Glomus versiforme]RHZ35973.1 hypothetical protein GvMRE_Ic3g93 [endosymbiont GvMRE of Glomus versiforme]